MVNSFGKIVLIMSISVVVASCGFMLRHKDIDYEPRTRLDPWLELNVILESVPDTLHFGDIIDITVVFHNKTDSLLLFRPDAFLTCHYHTEGVFVFDPSYVYLSKNSDLDKIVEIQPNDFYSKTYQVKIEKSWAVSGKGKYLIYYYSEKYEPEQSKALEGRLQRSFELFIQE